jgi:hypothetical protein
MNSVKFITSGLLSITCLLSIGQEAIAAPGWGDPRSHSLGYSVSSPSMDVLTGTSSIIPNVAAPELSGSQMMRARRGAPVAPRQLSTAVLVGAETVNQAPVNWTPPRARANRVGSVPESRPTVHPFDVNQGRYVGGSTAAPASAPVPPYGGEQRLQFDPNVGSFVTQSGGNGAGQNPEFSPELSPLERLQLLQDELRSYRVAPESWDNPYTLSPSVTISNPSGFGADNYRGFVGASFQSRTRYSGGPNRGGLFGGGRPDGTMGFGFGLGDARDSVGVQLSYTVASFGGSRPPGSGGINAKIHARLDNGWAVAVGGDGIVNFGRLPEGSPTTFNDFESTYYGSVTKVVALRPDISEPFSRAAFTVGLGSGRFRTVQQFTDRKFGIGVFGSAAVRALPNASLIAEWTGQDLAVGASIVPLRGFPLILSPAIRDLAGDNLDGPRFIMGVGGSIGNVLSLLDIFL